MDKLKEEAKRFDEEVEGAEGVEEEEEMRELESFNNPEQFLHKLQQFQLTLATQITAKPSTLESVSLHERFPGVTAVVDSDFADALGDGVAKEILMQDAE